MVADTIGTVGQTKQLNLTAGPGPYLLMANIMNHCKVLTNEKVITQDKTRYNFDTMNNKQYFHQKCDPYGTISISPICDPPPPNEA